MKKFLFNNVIRFNNQWHLKKTCVNIMLFCTILCTISILAFYSKPTLLNNKFSALFQNKLSFISQEMKTQHLVSLNVAQFIENAFESNITLILIEPSLLFKLISSSDQKLLISRKLVPQSYLSAENKNFEVITFAITQTDVKSFEAKFGVNIKKIVKGENGSKRHWNNTEELNIVTLHYLLILNKICIHITVLYSRNEFYWMGKFPDQELEFIHSQNIAVSYGKFEQAFDKFSLEKNLILNNITCYIPFETAHYISQIEFSRFIECDFDTNRIFRSNYQQKLIESKAFDERVLPAIVSMKALMKQLLLPFWIGSGTLLGWYRQCGVIPYTSDIDFITWSSYASPNITDKFVDNIVGLKVLHIYGLIENGYQYTMYTNESNFRLDMFYMYKEGDNFTFTGHIPSADSYFRYIYPYFELCSAELIGLKVLVPCNADQMIETEYGTNWTIPKTPWSYITSPFNTGPHKKWTNEEKAKTTYQKLY